MKREPKEQEKEVEMEKIEPMTKCEKRTVRDAEWKGLKWDQKESLI